MNPPPQTATPRPPFPPNPPSWTPKPEKAKAPEPKPEPKPKPDPEKKEKPKTKRPPEFMPGLRGKPITVHLVGGVEVAGILLGWNNYELLIRPDGRPDVLVFKGAITHIDGPDGWWRLPEPKESEEGEEPKPLDSPPAEG